MKRLVLFALSAFLLCSCANKSMTRYETLAPVLKKEGFEGTIQKIEKKKDDIYGKNSEFLYHFDKGMLYHYTGNNKESIKIAKKSFFIVTLVAIAQCQIFTDTILPQTCNLWQEIRI